MKKLIYLLFFTALLFLQHNAKAQNWELGGTSIVSPYTSVFGTLSPDIVYMISNNNPIMQLNTNGNVGVGDWSILIPSRKLDVYQQNNDPQLRLTYDFFNTPPNYNNNIFTDFLTNSNGDLIISPTFFTQPSTTVHRNVGINVAPTEMLDVDGNARIRGLINPVVGTTWCDLVLADNGSVTGNAGTLNKGPQINPNISIIQGAQNGLQRLGTFNMTVAVLGSSTDNDASSKLLNNTKILLDGNNVWFQDYINGTNPPNYPTINTNKFKIGNQYDLNNTNIGNTFFNNAKFTISDVSEYCTAFISNNSAIAKFGLFVDQSIRLYSPNTNTDFYYGIYSHVGGGVNSTYGVGNSLSENIAVYGNIDTSEARFNIGVKGRVSGFVGNGIINTPYNYGLYSEVTYNNPNGTNTSQENVGLVDLVQNNIDALWNSGVNVNVRANNNNGNFSQINKGYFAEIASNFGAASNRGVEVWLTQNNNNNNSSQENIGFYGSLNGNDASGTNFGTKLEVIGNNSSNYTNQENYGYNGEVSQNYQAFKNIGANLIVQDNNASGNDNTNQIDIGFKSLITNNINSAQNSGVEVEVSNNNINNTSQVNVGFLGNITNNDGARTNYGANLSVTGNNTSALNTQTNYGVNAIVNSNDGARQNFGANIEVMNNNSSQNASQNNFGVYALVDGNSYSHFNYGVFGQSSNPNATLNVGVAGIAMGSTNAINNPPTQGNIGVYGYGDSYSQNSPGNVHNTLPATSNIAGFFNGHLICTGDIWNPSDENLKEKINSADSALYKLSLLEAKTYYFKTKNFPGMALPHTQQFGLLAQDVAKIFPTLVSDFVNPALLDTSGKEIYPSVPFKAINYQAFIPLLIQSVKELKGNNDSLKNWNEDIKKTNDFLKVENGLQNEKINLQNKKIDSLTSTLSKFQNQLDNFALVLNECCKNNRSTGMNDENKTDINSTIKIVTDNSVNGNKTELYQNKPNPFKTITTFTYLLGTSGFVELEITDQYGQLIEKLVSTNQETGNYSIDWDSVKVAPGVYFYSLKVNSLLLVKKAIKVN